MERAREIGGILRKAGLFGGPLLWAGALALDVLSVVQMGLPLWAFQVIGGVAFVVSAASVIADQRKENRALKAQLDDRSRRHAIADRLGQFLSQGQPLMERVDRPMWQDEYKTWSQCTIAFLQAECRAADVSTFTTPPVPSELPQGRYANDEGWRRIERVLGQMDVLRDIIRRYQ
jgi:hypothetical protein